MRELTERQEAFVVAFTTGEGTVGKAATSTRKAGWILAKELIAFWMPSRQANRSDMRRVP
jgi:hypothetical protein